MPEPLTQPIPGLGTCGWCDISLRAIDLPSVQIRPDGMRYHPGGCVSAARSASRTPVPAGHPANLWESE